MKRMIVYSLLAVGAGASFGAAGWATDFEAAKRTAADEKKHLVVAFNGPDRCSGCGKLNARVSGNRCEAAMRTADVIEGVDSRSEFGRNVRRIGDTISRLGEGAAVRAGKQESRQVPVATPGKPAAGKEPARNEGGAKKSATSSDEQVEKALAAARARLETVTARLDEEHRRWEALDQQLAGTRSTVATLEEKLAAARKRAAAQEKAIAELQKEHDRTHNEEVAAKEAIAAHEQELRRRAEIARLREEARKLQLRAEALRKRAEELKRK